MISTRDLAIMIDRKMATIRRWDSELPDELRPFRDSRGRRYWRQEQVQGLVQWMHGRGGPQMNEEQVERYLEGVRKKREEVEILRDEVRGLATRVERIESTIDGGS